MPKCSIKCGHRLLRPPTSREPSTILTASSLNVIASARVDVSWRKAWNCWFSQLESFRYTLKINMKPANVHQYLTSQLRSQQVLPSLPFYKALALPWLILVQKRMFHEVHPTKLLQMWHDMTWYPTRNVQATIARKRTPTFTTIPTNLSHPLTSLNLDSWHLPSQLWSPNGCPKPFARRCGWMESFQQNQYG